MYSRHWAARSSHGKCKESSEVLSLWLSHQSFWRRALAKELQGCSRHFRLTGSCLMLCHFHLAFLKILLFLLLFYFPSFSPRGLPFPLFLFFLSVCLCLSWSFLSSGSWILAAVPERNLEISFPPAFRCRFKGFSPCSSYRSSSGLCSCASSTCQNGLSASSCARHRLAKHLLDQARGVEGRSRALETVLGWQSVAHVSLHHLWWPHVFDILIVSIFPLL